LTERDTAREGTQAGGVGEGEAGFPLSREPDGRARSQDPGIVTGAEGRRLMAEPPRHPHFETFLNNF